MGHRRGKFDMPHTLTTDLGKRNFNTAFFADNSAIFHALIFAAKTLIIFRRAKNAGTKKTIPFGLERPVIDRLWLFYLTIGPGKNFFRACNRNLNRIESLWWCVGAEYIGNILVHGLSAPQYSLESRSSTLRPRDLISLTNTLKLSGIPASKLSSPRTMDSYTLVRPATSSDLTVNISCKV